MLILIPKELLYDTIDSMVWSYTRLNSFYICKRAWYLNYVLKVDNKENFFSQYGILAHKTLEKYNKGELELFELSEYFNENYFNFITEQAPPNKYVDLNSSYYEKGIAFFNNFQGEEGETIGAEDSFEFFIKAHGKPRKIIGYIDRISKDKNGIVVTDYKSKGKFKNNKEMEEYCRQLYIYSIAIKEKYGEYPYKMVINQFKENKYICIDFNYKKLLECKKWIRNTIDLIFDECEFSKTENDFFCNYICGIGKDICSA